MFNKNLIKKFVPVLLLAIILSGFVPSFSANHADSGISVCSDFEEEYIVLD